MRSRQKVLDATLDLIGGGGFKAVSIASVAQAAGVTRQTVYSIFGTREDLVSQAMAGRLTAVASDIQRELDAAAGPVEYLVELLVACRAVVRADLVMAALLRSEANNPLFDEGAVTRARIVARHLLQPFSDQFPDNPVPLDEIAEIAVHLGMSVVFFDDPALREDDALRAFLHRWLAPAMTRRSS